MSFIISQIKEHLTGLGHGGTLNKVRNIEAMMERSASSFLLKCHTLESMRLAPLANFIYDDIFNYALPSDFGSLIDLFPQDNRQTWDRSLRDNAGKFDAEKAIKTKVISIEGLEGTKIIRINWRSRSGKTLNTMDSLTSNGAWAAVATAANVALDTIYKYSGSGSIKFDLVATGDGIQNTTMNQVDMTEEDEVADVFIPFFVKNSADLAKITNAIATWGNDLTTKFWTGVAQTAQYDGRAFQVGWNVIKVPWSTASETGTVTPSTIDSFKLVLTTTGDITDLRVDNIIFTIGRAFDIKYYSKFLFKNSAGTYISRTTSDDDIVLVDNDTLPLFLMECLEDMAHQMEGSTATFDASFAENKLKMLFPAYKGIYPSQVKKVAGQYGGKPARGRW